MVTDWKVTKKDIGYESRFLMRHKKIPWNFFQGI
jgi:hypothetical protein